MASAAGKAQAEKEAKAAEKEADKAIKPSWMALKFAPDYQIASMEYGNAAAKYRVAGLLEDCSRTWLLSAEFKVKAGDQFGAGRAYEQAGQISEGGAAGGPAEAMKHWDKAVYCFRLCGKAEIAAKLLQKMAERCDKMKDIDQAKQNYMLAIEVYTDDEKDYNLGDVYKAYIGFLLRSGLLEESLKAMDGFIGLLRKQRHFPFVYKELLSKVVILLHLKDNVRAEEAMSPSQDVEGWYPSNECQMGHELVTAFQEYDAEQVEKLSKEQVFSFLQVEVARLARQLRVPQAAAPRPAAPKPAAKAATPSPQTAGGYSATGAAPVAAATAPVTVVSSVPEPPAAVSVAAAAAPAASAPPASVTSAPPPTRPAEVAPAAPAAAPAEEDEDLADLLM